MRGHLLGDKEANGGAIDAAARQLTVDVQTLFRRAEQDIQVLAGDSAGQLRDTLIHGRTVAITKMTHTSGSSLNGSSAAVRRCFAAGSCDQTSDIWSDGGVIDEPSERAAMDVATLDVPATFLSLVRLTPGCYPHFTPDEPSPGPCDAKESPRKPLGSPRLLDGGRGKD